MTFRVIGTSPAQPVFKSTIDANGEHIPHVIDDSGGGGGGTVDQGAAGATPWLVETDKSTAPTVYNVTLTLANTEYSQLLPANTREFRFRCRTLYDVRFAFVTGKVATPTAPYLTLPAGMEYSSDGNDLAAVTLYLASSQAGVVAELEVWL